MGKTLIIGGNSGIGLSIAVQLLQRGYEKTSIVVKEMVNKKDIPFKENLRSKNFL